MTPKKRILSVVLTLALGLGVWTLAFTYQTADFAEGDVLSASELNTLLNDNFQAASDAVDDLDAAKVDRDGDAMTGRLDISAVAQTSGDTGDPTTVFRVENTASDGSAAVFEGASDGNVGVVSVKQNGAAPALSLKANGGGPLIAAGDAVGLTFAVDADGSIRVGDMGAGGTDAPTLHLDAAAGTVTNDVGSGLPLAFGQVASDGSLRTGASTTNVTASQEAGPHYRISIDGESYSYDDYVTTVTPVGSVAYAETGSVSGDLLVFLYDESGAEVAADFNFVTYKPGD